jgi:hypothetical protein
MDMMPELVRNCCSLFPQDGCLLARSSRVGQNDTANNFGVCMPGPVRPLRLLR